MGNRRFAEGQRWGRWTIVAAYVDDKKRKHLCRCECGTERQVDGCHLGRGASTSCGCFAVEDMVKRFTKHGGKGTRTYNIWKGMKRRCLNVNDAGYPRYGGAGITVCARWRDSYESFLEDMGECPPGLTLDRIDGEKGYSKDNCRWATYKKQAENRRARGQIKHRGIKQIPSGRYVANICHNYKNHYLGSFAELSDAIAARDLAEERLWGL